MNKKISSFAVVLILIGIIVLISNLGIMQNAGSKLWPLVLIAIGIVSIINSVDFKSEK